MSLPKELRVAVRQMTGFLEAPSQAPRGTADPDVLAAAATHRQWSKFHVLCENFCRKSPKTSIFYLWWHPTCYPCGVCGIGAVSLQAVMGSASGFRCLSCHQLN